MACIGVNERFEKCAAIAFILPRPTSLGVRLPIGPNRVLFRTLVALPLLLSVFSAKVFLDAREVAKCSGRVMVDARFLRANVNLFLYNVFVGPLLELPWQVVASPVELQVLVSLETLVADFAHESICGHQSSGREFGFGFGLGLEL
ncbi:heat shock protein DnaJ with tetratricopeptiderepeat, partial [Striga asiatica]